MTEDGKMMGAEEDLVPSQNFVINTTGDPQDMPLDIYKKTVQELKDMGLQEVSKFELKPNVRRGTMEPNMTGAEIQRLKESLNLQDLDENDPAYYRDTLPDEFDSATPE